MEEKIKVYIKTNEENYITKVGSSIFVRDTTDWIEIDQGYGDKYAHAQSQYLDNGIYSENGEFNYKYIDGKVVEVEHHEQSED